MQLIYYAVDGHRTHYLKLYCFRVQVDGANFLEKEGIDEVSVTEVVSQLRS